MDIRKNDDLTVTAKSRLTLCADNSFFGPGVCELLERIHETGSIQAAAARMELSYTKAWKILNQAEKELGVNLIRRVSGGRNGGSSTLTEAGEKAVTDYRVMEAKLSAYADELLKAYWSLPGTDDPGRTGVENGTGNTERFMPGLFETLAGGTVNGPGMAAWIIGGKAAGCGAILASDEKGYTLLYRDEGFPQETAEEICKLTPGTTGILEIGETRLFLEPVPGGRKLVICGAGHVSLALIRLCAPLGFEITVIEDREEYAGKARKAGADRVICKPFGEALDGMSGDRSTAFVIMTRDHIHDVDCLRRILRKPYAYAGMMGSRSRTEQIREQMLREEYEAGKVGDLHMPIGLPIGSRTPEEIAVSVAAELVQVMNASDPGEGFPEGLAEELAGCPRGVLAMIVEKNGEAPRRPGTKMLVREDGSFRGTVGGGYAEAEILQISRKMIRDGSRESRLVSISMQKGTMQCGGEITVFLLPLEGKEENER